MLDNTTLASSSEFEATIIIALSILSSTIMILLLLVK